MRRLTTPTHSFTLPFDESVVSKFLLSYVQDDQIVLEKTKDEVLIDGNVWSVMLSQEETKKFKPGAARAQIRVLTHDGKALASDVFQFAVAQVLNEVVLE